MRKHKFLRDVADMIAEGKAIVAKSEDLSFAHKVSIVILSLGGMSTNAISEIMGYDPRTIQMWVAKADSQGFDALRPGKSTGRPQKLTTDQKSQIQQALQRDASNYGYSTWDGIALSDYISKTFGVKLSVRACQYLFHELGFSLIRPQTYPHHNGGSEAEREAFKKNSKH